MPPAFSECFRISQVSLNCSCPLSRPIPLICFRPDLPIFAVVRMPKTSVYEHRYLVSRQHYIRATWQLLHINAESKSHSVQSRTNSQFRLGVPSPNSGHVIASLCRRMDVHLSFQAIIFRLFSTALTGSFRSKTRRPTVPYIDRPVRRRHLTLVVECHVTEKSPKHRLQLRPLRPSSMRKTRPLRGYPAPGHANPSKPEYRQR